MFPQETILANGVAYGSYVYKKFVRQSRGAGTASLPERQSFASRCSSRGFRIVSEDLCCYLLSNYEFYEYLFLCIMEKSSVLGCHFKVPGHLDSHLDGHLDSHLDGHLDSHLENQNSKWLSKWPSKWLSKWLSKWPAI